MTTKEKEIFWNSVPDSLREDMMELIAWGLYTEEEAINKLLKEGFKVLNMKNHKNIYLRCDDNAETVVFTKYNWNDNEIHYEFAIEDSYCGGDYMGIKGRFKRAWKAFWGKPISYTGVYCQSGERMRDFLQNCLDLMEEQNNK